MCVCACVCVCVCVRLSVCKDGWVGGWWKICYIVEMDDLLVLFPRSIWLKEFRVLAVLFVCDPASDQLYRHGEPS